jgi:hypothetical protein
MSNKRTSKISNRFTSLVDLNNYDLSNLYFDTPNELEIQQGNKTIKYFKIPIGSKTDKGIGELIIDFPHFCHSFGIDEFQNEAGKATNHSVSLSLIDINAPEDEKAKQLTLVTAFQSLVEQMKKHLIQVKKEIKKPTLEMNDLKKLCPVNQSIDDEGKPKGEAWYFSPKLMERKIYNKDDPSDIQVKMDTKFYMDDQTDEKGDPVEVSPLEFIGKKHFKFRGAIKIDNIYIGSKISIQCKVYDGVVSTISKERKRLTQIAPASVTSSVKGMESSSSVLLQDEQEEDLEILLDD